MIKKADDQVKSTSTRDPKSKGGSQKHLANKEAMVSGLKGTVQLCERSKVYQKSKDKHVKRKMRTTSSQRK